MKIQIAVSDENYEEVKKYLTEKGLELDDEAPDYILVEKNKYVTRLSVRHPQNGERILLPADEIISIESYGHTVEVNATGGKYLTSLRLCQIETMLDPVQFLRVSNSVIASRQQIRHISPSLSMKFVLLMRDGRKIQVTRSYYQSFKDALGI